MDKLIQELVGKTVFKIQNNSNADEGYTIIFKDGSILQFGFSSNEGQIKVFVPE